MTGTHSSGRKRGRRQLERLPLDPSGFTVRPLKGDSDRLERLRDTWGTFATDTARRLLTDGLDELGIKVEEPVDDGNGLNGPPRGRKREQRALDDHKFILTPHRGDTHRADRRAEALGIDRAAVVRDLIHQGLDFHLGATS